MILLVDGKSTAVRYNNLHSSRGEKRAPTAVDSPSTSIINKLTTVQTRDMVFDTTEVLTTCRKIKCKGYQGVKDRTR